MTPWNSQTYKRVLLALRAQLRDDVNLLTEVAVELMSSDGPPRPSGTCRACRPFWRTSIAKTIKRELLRLIERKERMLAQIGIALKRLEGGTYGICEKCDTAIPDDWLATVPYTTLCVTCDSRLALE